MPSILVYIILLFILMPAFYVASKEKGSLVNKPYIWFSIILASIIIGLRWNVNEDWDGYYDLFQNSVAGELELERIELLPRYFIIIIKALGLPYYSFFIIMASLQFVFLMLTANCGFKILLPWFLFFYFYSLFPLSMIITRQVVALTIVLYAYTFIHKKKLIPYLCLIALAFCFHRTALLCLPLYWITPFFKLKSVFFQILIVCFFIVIGNRLIGFFLSFIPADLEGFRYAHYVGSEFDYGAKSGLGVIVNYSRYFLIILYSNQLRERYEKYGFSVFFALLFLEACTYSAFKDDLVFSRVEMYFSIADIVTSSCLLHYLLTGKQQKKIIYLGVISVLSLMLFIIAYRSPSWQFIWEAPYLLR